MKYWRALLATEQSLKDLRFQLLAAEDEEALEELDDVDGLYAQRMGGGLQQLQELAVVIAFACTHGRNQSSRSDNMCLMKMQSKLHADRLGIQDVLTVLREHAAHIATDAADDLDQQDDDDDEDDDAPFAFEVKADNKKIQQYHQQKRSVLVQWSALLGVVGTS